MVNAVFNIISVISRRPLHLFMLSWSCKSRDSVVKGSLAFCEPDADQDQTVQV